jgi:hypothetical protein
MFKFFKVLFAVVPTAVVFSAVTEARSGHHGGGGPTYQNDARLVQLIHINAYSPFI